MNANDAMKRKTTRRTASLRDASNKTNEEVQKEEMMVRGMGSSGFIALLVKLTDQVPAVAGICLIKTATTVFPFVFATWKEVAIFLFSRVRARCDHYA